MWTGDNNSSWDSMALSIPMFQTLGLSGESFVGADGGGFMGRSDGEMVARWYQIGFLTPFFRNHHALGHYDQEPWRFGTRYEDVIRKYVQLRYRLIPYLYTVLAEAHETGVPWFRPLLMEYQNDYNVINIDDEFMVGDSLLCAPVLKDGARSRDLYLPQGTWFNFFSGEKYEGGRYITVNAPLDTVPLFVKAGSVLPVGPAMDYLGQLSDANPAYRVFPDKDGRAEGKLYLDDGKSTAYKNGDCDHFSLRYADGKLQICSDKSSATAEQLTKNAELMLSW
jgi:alpha-glucosidase